MQSKTFSNSFYEEAHERLDKIFNNGLYEDMTVCGKLCGGKCCSMPGDETAPWVIDAVVWNEHLYYQDLQGENSTEGANLKCLRTNKKDCISKPLICKLHPFYPRRISILYSECDFGIVISEKRKYCSSIPIKEELLKQLSDFYAWLYSFEENRLAYLFSDIFEGIPDKYADEIKGRMLTGVQVGQTIYTR